MHAFLERQGTKFLGRLGTFRVWMRRKQVRRSAPFLTSSPSFATSSSLFRLLPGRTMTPARSLCCCKCSVSSGHKGRWRAVSVSRTGCPSKSITRFISGNNDKPDAVFLTRPLKPLSLPLTIFCRFFCTLSLGISSRYGTLSISFLILVRTYGKRTEAYLRPVRNFPRAVAQRLP